MRNVNKIITGLSSVWVIYLTLAGLALVASLPMFIDGWFWTHEECNPIERIIALTQEIGSGNLYPRWLSSTYHGKGSPFFNFYSPFFHFAAAYLHLTGVPLLACIKLLLGLLFFAGAVGVFHWIRRHYGNTGGGIAAVLYIFIPYHFVDIYVRGALAEFSALAVLPYFFLGIDLLIEKPVERKYVILTSSAVAIILLSHQLSAIMIAPFALIYSLARLSVMGFTRQRFLLLLATPFTAAGLSAFYWLPVIIEKKYLVDFVGAVLKGAKNEYYYADHYIFPAQWISNYWGFGPSVKGANDGMSFQIGIILIAVTVIGTVSSLFLAKRERYFHLSTLALGLFGLFMTSGFSDIIYRSISFLAFIQFPWRFLGPATLFFCCILRNYRRHKNAGLSQNCICNSINNCIDYFFNKAQNRICSQHINTFRLWKYPDGYEENWQLECRK